jgi:DNA-binding transcriptional regulator PaaX
MVVDVTEGDVVKVLKGWQGPSTFTQIGQAFGVSTRGLTGALQGLVEAGKVSVTTENHTNYYELTDKGRAV